MKKRIPLNSLQTKLYEILKTYQTTDVYDSVPENAIMPYITIGAFTCKPNGAKNTDISDVTTQLGIWSEYKGKAEVNEIANDIIEVISAVEMDLSADGFKVMDQDYDMFESFEVEENGYHGVVTFVAKVQNLIT